MAMQDKDGNMSPHPGNSLAALKVLRRGLGRRCWPPPISSARSSRPQEPGRFVVSRFTMPNGGPADSSAATEELRQMPLTHIAGPFMAPLRGGLEEGISHAGTTRGKKRIRIARYVH